MVSVKNEINEVLLNTISDLENRLDESRSVLSDIQEKMDAKVSEAKEYKVQVDSAKENIKRLESEIVSLENDLVELKEKYGKKNLVAVIDAGTKEINTEIKKKQDEIQVHKNKIAELTNRARSIKDLLMNLKKDKKIKEERLKELEICTNYYKVRLERVVGFAEEHDNLDDYFVSLDEDIDIKNDTNVFLDIVGEETDELKEDVSLEMTDEIFNDVINPIDEDETESENDTSTKLEQNIEEAEEQVEEEISEDNILIEEKEEFQDNSDELENTRDLQINDLLSSVKEPLSEIAKEEKVDKVSNLNKAIDEEFENIFGKSINEPIKTMDIFGNEFAERGNEEDTLVNKLTNIGLDYYSFTDQDKEIIKNTFNEQTAQEIVKILNDNKIQLDNIYVDGKLLSSIAPAELSNIIAKLLSAGQSAEAIGYVLDKLPIVDSKLLENTITNYGDYIKNVDIVDIIFKSLKGDN